MHLEASWSCVRLGGMGILRSTNPDLAKTDIFNVIPHPQGQDFRETSQDKIT